MTASHRIAFNAMATYGRTVLRILLGVFSSRWVLESLGQVDYGLMGVVGSLITFIVFLNTVAAGSCARFFAHSIGKNDNDDLVRWFNAGLSVHVVLPIILIAVGFPVGEWAIDNFLVIPADRIPTAHWVFRFSLLSAFWSMASTPFIAMYTATQNIVELTLWEITGVLINFGFVFWLTTYKGDAWLVYAGFTVVLAIVLGLGQVIRAIYRYPGCRVRFAYWGDWVRLKQMMSFSGWSLFGSLGYMVRTQIPSVLLNKYYPPMVFPAVNASYAVGTSLASYTQTFGSSLMGAFMPEIATRDGAGDSDGVTRRAFQASKFGTLLTVFFAIPVCLEVDYLLVLWLKNPPEYAGVFCRLVIIQTLLDNLTFGHMSSIMAKGRIAAYQLTTGMLCVMSLPVAWVWLAAGGAPETVSISVALCVGACSAVRLYFGRMLLNIRVGDWLRQVFAPICLVSSCSAFFGALVVIAIKEASFVRLILTTSVCVLTMAVMAWSVVCSESERMMLKNMWKRIRSRF